jgi:osmotically-inducible protein OsmY
MTDDELQQAATDELVAEPRIDATRIAVAAEDGVVTLRGTVGSPRQKVEAGRAVRRVRGVHDVKNDLEVRLLVGDRRDDAELRADVLQALMLNVLVPSTIDAKVDNGIVTLTGRANWHFERDEAEYVTGNVRGVRGIRSEIVLQPMPDVADIKESITQGFQRNAAINADQITIESYDDGTVILSGYVSSWAEKREALGAAWSAPGVSRVTDCLNINYG